MSNELLKVFEPLFKELNEGINLVEFIDAASRLYNTLTLPDKNLVLAYNSKKKVNTSLDQHNLRFHVFAGH